MGLPPKTDGRYGTHEESKTRKKSGGMSSRRKKAKTKPKKNPKKTGRGLHCRKRRHADWEGTFLTLGGHEGAKTGETKGGEKQQIVRPQ